MSKSFYQKDEYSLEDLDNLIKNGIEESLQLDYKASGSLSKEDKKKSEISKDISAFANSDGGIIIYGISEENHKPTSYSYIDGTVYTKEWLENIIDGNIQQRIKGVKIFPIRFNGELEKSIYIVKIPASIDAPHICSDKKYYRRYNFKSVPMEEYEIRLLYRRLSISEMDILSLWIAKGENSKNKNDINVFNRTVSILIKNISTSIELNCKVQVKIIDTSIDGIGFYYDQNSNISHHLVKDVGNENNFVISGYNKAPIFPDEELSLFSFTLQIETAHFERFKNEGVIAIKLYDSSSTKTAEYELKSII